MIIQKQKSTYQEMFENAVAALLVALTRLSQDKPTRTQNTKRK